METIIIMVTFWFFIFLVELFIYLNEKPKHENKPRIDQINLPPTKKELEKYPALKNAWEEYQCVRRLIGRE